MKLLGRGLNGNKMQVNDNIDRIKQLQLKKQTIIELLKNRGPLLPGVISREIGMSLLFTSALLSEMVNDKSIKFTYLKIGGSPLYYLEGQETMLDNFTKYLQFKEKEVFEKLKEFQVLDEESLEPAHRVAIKNIKDFAFPIKISTEGKDKTFWRFHLLTQEDALKKIEEILKQRKKETKEYKEEQKVKEEKKEEKQEKIKVKISRKKDKEEFYEKIYRYLKEQGLEIITEINEEDRVCIVSANFNFGKAKLLVVANSKKKISEADLSLAYQQGLLRKMPVLFLIQGELTKKAKAYCDILGSYFFVKKID